jgi:ferredoxin
MPQSNQTVLDLAESLGVPIDSQCRAGICGTCRCKLLAGRVTMEARDALSDADEADGYILACQARATEDVTIEA